MVLASLPTCAINDVGRTLTVAGGTGLAAQICLDHVFRRFRVRNSASRAHGVVALSFMILLSGYGLLGWQKAPTTAVDRLLLGNGSARWMGATVVGAMTLWDVPTTLLIRGLRKTDVLVHHCVMALVALVGAVQLPTHYAFFYLGVSELSSIPLVLLELLAVNDAKTPGASKTLQTILETITALMFSVVRVFYFTKVTLLNFIPDVINVCTSGLRIPLKSRAAMYFLFVASLGFTALQLYWFYTQILVEVFSKSED